MGGALDKFMSECNRFFTATQNGDDFVLDICSKKNDACLDNEEWANHAGCCCGSNPVTEHGLISTTGKGNEGNEGKERRVVGVTSDVREDICAQIWTDTRPVVSCLRRIMTDAEFHGS